jgi:hypothetical protein
MRRRILSVLLSRGGAVWVELLRRRLLSVLRRRLLSVLRRRLRSVYHWLRTVLHLRRLHRGR